MKPLPCRGVSSLLHQSQPLKNGKRGVLPAAAWATGLPPAAWTNETMVARLAATPRAGVFDFTQAFSLFAFHWHDPGGARLGVFSGQEPTGVAHSLQSIFGQGFHLKMFWVLVILVILRCAPGGVVVGRAKASPSRGVVASAFLTL